MIELSALITGVVITSLIGLIVFAKNNRSITTRIFLVLTIGLIGWSVTTYLSLHTSSDEQTLFWIRWIMFFVVLQNTSLFFLIRVFPANQFDLFKRKYIIATIYSIITAGITVSPLLFIDFKESPVPGPGMVIFIPHALVSVLGGLVFLIMRVRKAKGLEKVQLQYLLAGAILMFTFEPIGNFIAPVLFKQNQLVIFSPLYSIIFSGLIAYAIIKHRLFDIRLVVARAVAYTLLVIILGGTYVIATLLATSIFLGDTANRSQLIVYSILTLIIAYTFQPLRKVLENLTDNIFYKGKYDSPELISRLTKIMATTLKLEDLTKGLLTHLIPEMRLSKGAFVLVKNGGLANYDTFGFSKKPRFVSTDIISLLETDKILIRDEVDRGKLRKIMEELDVTSSVPLKVGDEEFGVLLLGHKLSGEIYTNQDIKILEILSPEISIAIQNAKAYDELSKFSVKLQREVLKATTNLRAANERLKELDKAKDEFVSVVSHELRTPMTAVKSYVWLALNGRAGPVNNKMRNYLFKVYQSSERLIGLINDVLDVSHIETGRINLDIQAVSPVKVAGEVITTLQARAAEQEIKLELEKSETIPMVAADPMKLNEILVNLIGNALKFTPKGGSITVSFSKQENLVEVSVTDTGIGIPKEDLSKLFTKFGRIAKSYSTIAQSTGSGLGLYITKNYLGLMGGKIWVNSELGKGTTFTFSLPIAKNQKIKEIVEASGSEITPRHLSWKKGKS